MNWLTAKLKPSNGHKEHGGTFSVTGDPVIFTAHDHEARMLEERLNKAATDFYLTITSQDTEIRDQAYADLSAQPPQVVSDAFIVVLQRTEGFDRQAWGTEFVGLMAASYGKTKHPEQAEEFGKAVARGLLDTGLGIPEGITDALTKASLARTRVTFADLPDGAMYDLGLKTDTPESQPAS